MIFSIKKNIGKKIKLVRLVRSSCGIHINIHTIYIYMIHVIYTHTHTHMHIYIYNLHAAISAVAIRVEKN
jgi:hypothetical protein